MRKYNPLVMFSRMIDVIKEDIFEEDSFKYVLLTIFFICLFMTGITMSAVGVIGFMIKGNWSYTFLSLFNLVLSYFSFGYILDDCEK